MYFSYGDLMDFNKAFQAYDTVEGANCLTAPNKMSQKEAAIEAVQKIGLNQISEVDYKWFSDNSQREMFIDRLEILKKKI